MEKIKEIQKMLTQIKSLGKTIILQWIPAQCGIQGNEKADILAKRDLRSCRKKNINYHMNPSNEL